MSKRCIESWGAIFLVWAGLACSTNAGQTAPSGPRYSKSGYDLSPLAPTIKAEILKGLDAPTIEITQRAGTERPWSSPLNKIKEEGLFVSAVGGLPLFRSQAKFESGTGWPSFYEPFDPAHIIEKVDTSHGMRRIEVLDARSGAHLGHVFDDGPKPGGKRYCINGAALRFIPKDTPLPKESQPARIETAWFAGGCFWGVEDVFEQTAGVIDAVSGYQGGHWKHPTYAEVCSGKTGHAEAVEVRFDADRVSYTKLLEVFFKNHDATQLNRQGPDIGEQYRSAIFTADERQRAEASAFIQRLQARPEYSGKKIVTQVQAGATFYRAEDKHQDYHKRNGGSCKPKQ